MWTSLKAKRATLLAMCMVSFSAFLPLSNSFSKFVLWAERGACVTETVLRCYRYSPHTPFPALLKRVSNESPGDCLQAGKLFNRSPALLFDFLLSSFVSVLCRRLVLS